jgi:hypothetical protein
MNHSKIRKYRGVAITPNYGADNYLRWCVNLDGKRDRKFRSLDECHAFIDAGFDILHPNPATQSTNSK